jgi:hypothetical protein
MSTPITAEQARTLLDGLASALIQAGLHATVARDGTVEARNPGVAGTGPLGAALSPGLRQTVALRRDGRDLAWYWVWSGPTRDAPDELEPLGPGDDVAQAAERIAGVLRLAGAEPLR